MIKKLVNEPLVHFAIGALCIFAAFSWFGLGTAADDKTIVINKTRLAQQWQVAWRRPPSEDELNTLIEESINEEILYREALRYGLDRNDAIVRNRMLQKMQFLQDQQLAEPSTQDLEEWLASHEQTYVARPSITFKHYYLGQQATPEKLQAHLSALVNNQALDIPQLNNVATSFTRTNEREIARLFGEQFASKIPTLEPRQWHAPVVSGYGLHAVYVAKIEQNPAPTLSDAATRKRVKNDWRAAQRSQARVANLQKLRQDYLVELREE